MHELGAPLIAPGPASRQRTLTRKSFAVAAFSVFVQGSARRRTNVTGPGLTARYSRGELVPLSHESTQDRRRRCKRRTGASVLNETEETLSILRKSKETILLLASDPAISKAIRKALEAGGYFVLEAQSIGRAIEWLKDCDPHLLIVRHYTEFMSGHEAAMFLRTLRPGLPVLILGGLLDDPDLEARAAAQNFDVFPKPYAAAELLAEVKKALLKYSGGRPHGPLA
jgi:CheY-like chemotaxis protein